MKEIKAYIKSQRLMPVIEELHKIKGLTGVSIHDIRGYGRTRNTSDQVQIVDTSINFVPHVKLEIICLDHLVDEIISAIEKGAHTGLRADGKIYISTVDEAFRISTGERGEIAV